MGTETGLLSPRALAAAAVLSLLLALWAAGYALDNGWWAE